MTWFEQAANQAESEKEHVDIFIAVDFDFFTGHARFWTGLGEITIRGQVFTGAGELGKITFPPEKSGLSIVTSKSYQLSGADVNPMLISDDDIQKSFGRPIMEYFGFLNRATGQLVAEPELNWEGLINGIGRRDGAEPSIEINAEHRARILDQSSDWRNTHEHQQMFYAGDEGFLYTKASLLREIVWGGQIVTPGSPRSRRNPKAAAASR